jgi:riboflavin synthase
MFTGIIEKTAAVTSLLRRSSGAVLGIENPWPGEPLRGEPLRPGESISVSGACLTLVSADEREISFDISAETLKKTTLGRSFAGRAVNLERSLRVGDSISGHFVSGHVDGTGKILRFEKSGEFAEVIVDVGPELAIYVVPKGSIAIDGVSLTVATLEESVLSVALIPETLARTTLGTLRPGDELNIETDMIGKYVVRYLARAGNGPAGTDGGLTIEHLTDSGF